MAPRAVGQLTIGVSSRLRHRDRADEITCTPPQRDAAFGLDAKVLAVLERALADDAFVARAGSLRPRAA
ncbi:MAG: hypothetical protein IPG91_11565 [Ideonella sp.]|nr:hypothetical protein [Ideonella sp.]